MGSKKPRKVWTPPVQSGGVPAPEPTPKARRSSKRMTKAKPPGRKVWTPPAQLPEPVTSPAPAVARVQWSRVIPELPPDETPELRREWSGWEEPMPPSYTSGRLWSCPSCGVRPGRAHLWYCPRRRPLLLASELWRDGPPGIARQTIYGEGHPRPPTLVERVAEANLERARAVPELPPPPDDQLPF